MDSSDRPDRITEHGIVRGFAYITVADFIVRSAYQMGKAPLLPIFAASLGAAGPLLGSIVSVSTLTGMVLKPFVGILSDRWGRRSWLILGTAFFAGMPFVYQFVDTPGHLFATRVIHGVATAIYGPVTLAYVAERSHSHRAERLGWFGMARNAGYVVGPAVAGWLLLIMSPVSVFTVIGILSTIAFVPVLLLPERPSAGRANRIPLGRQVRRALASGVRTPAVWLAGGIDATFYVAFYATKAFLPIYALSLGISVGMVGTFFAVQAAMHMLLSPVGGRLADRLGLLKCVCLGMVVMGANLPLLPYASDGFGLMLPAALMGIAQALVVPSTVALVSRRVDPNSIATGMGLVGMLRNAGKVIGPTLAGVLTLWLDFATTFQLIGAMLILGAAAIWYRGIFTQAALEQKRVASV